MQNNINKLYGIINIETGKLESHLTNPGHKFWEVKGHCKNALINYTKHYEKSSNKNIMINPNNLKLVEFNLSINKYLNIND